jgi:ribulose-phosphate 3-epimerase
VRNAHEVWGRGADGVFMPTGIAVKDYMIFSLCWTQKLANLYREVDMPLIAPSLLCADFSRLSQEIATVTTAGADMLHLDIMDGHFVPNLTFGNPVVRDIIKVSTIPTDAHLMVANPGDYIAPFAQAGVSYFSFHIEATAHSHRIIEKIKSHGMKAGVAINPGTSLYTIIDTLPDIDFVLIMSVNPGFAGQKFIPSAIEKIKFLHAYRVEKKLSFLIEIDGGISDKNISSVVSAGIDIVVAGSYIFADDDYQKKIWSLKNV